jgi:tetratricopeptide (TPR) repeat protein
MQRYDRRGLSLSCDSTGSVEGYEQALGLLQGYYVDPLKAIDDTLAAEPGFLMGHVFRAALFVTSTERRAVGELEKSVTAAEALVARGVGTERERAHVGATRAWLDGNFAGAAARYNRLVVDHPRDMLAVQIGHLCNFFLGRSTWLRDHIAGVLPHYSTSEPSYGLLLGMHAFGLEENNEFARAQAAGERALEHNARDPWAIHALAHCAEMQGRSADGIALYQSREQDWAVDNFFSIHNWWHLGLFHLDRGDDQRVLEIYDEKIRASHSEMNLDIVDASAYLWRLELCGIDVGAARWQELAHTWQRVGEQGYYAFNDLHALMAFAGARRAGDVESVLVGLEAAARGAGTNAAMARDVALPAARAFVAFADGDYLTAIAELYDLRPIAARFGGSNAQRDILDWTLVEAALRAGDQALARSLVEPRVARKPTSGLQRKTLARVFESSAAPRLVSAGSLRSQGASLAL